MTNEKLDLAVAKLVGIVSPDSNADEIWDYHPSSDWNVAMDAAEKVGLFHAHAGRFGTWRWHLTGYKKGEIHLSRLRDHSLRVINADDTIINSFGPRAICEAIVATKGTE